MEWKISIVSPIYYNPIAILNLTYEEMLGGGGEDLMETTCVRRRQRGSITLAKQPGWTKPLPLPVFPMIFISRNKTISMSCGDGNKPLDMLINSWISWTNNQRWRLLVMIRLWWCFQGVARNWLMSAAFRNGGAFSFLPPLPPASVKLSPSICYYPQQNSFNHFWDILTRFFCVCLTHQRMLDKQWKWVLHVASIQRVPQHGKPITQIIQGVRRGRVIICFSGCLVVANHLGVGGAIRCWIREINYLCLALSSELYHVANCRKRARIERSNYLTNFILKCWYHNCYIW